MNNDKAQYKTKKPQSKINQKIKKADYKTTSEVDKLQNYTIKQLNTRINKLEKLPELKYLDITSSGVINNTGFLEEISSVVPQGVGSSFRVGGSIRLYSINMKFNCSIAPTQSLTQIRIFIFKYKDNYDQLAGILDPTDWLNATNTVGAIVPSARDSYNFYCDQVLQLSQATNPQMLFRFNQKLGNQLVRYNDTVGNLGTTNHVFFYVFSDQAVNQPFYNFNIRLYYTDA